MKDDSLIIPLILDSRQQGFLDRSFCLAEHSALTSWGFGENELRDARVPPGIAIGCADGSVFIFHAQEDRKRKKKTPETLNLSALQFPSSSARRSTPSGSPSPLPSPASTSSKGPSKGVLTSSLVPLTQPGRSRVVSGLSTTPAEAPKNYVDFEPEMDRLEGILRSSSSKNKSFLENLRLSPAHVSTSRLPDFGQASHKTHSRTAPPSRASSPRHSISSPPSPTPSSFKMPQMPAQPFPSIQADNSNPPQLKLKYHIYPHLFVPDNPLISLKYLFGGLLLALLKNGTIFAINIASGICVASIDLNNPPYFQPPPSMTSASSVKLYTAVWNWTQLQAIESTDHTTVMAVASSITSISADKEPGSHSRIAILQLMPLQHSNLQRREGMLTKVGEWMVENDSSNFYIFKDDYTSLVHLLCIESHALLSRTLEIVPEAYTIAAPDSLQPSAEAISSSLVAPPATSPPTFLVPLPLSFKPKEDNAQSQSRAGTPKVISGRVLLGPPVAIGDLPSLEGNQSRIRILDFNVKMIRGCVWNDHEFYLFRTSTDSPPKILGHINHRHSVDVIGATSGTVFLKGERHVRAFGLPETWWDITEDFKLEIISSAELSSSSPLVTVLSSSYALCTDPDNSQESISLRCIPFVPYRTKRNSKRLEHSPSKPKTAWSPNGKMLELTSNRITSLLPLNSEHIAVGDSNGNIQKTSLTTLMSTGLPRALPSGNTLGAYITSLHLVQSHGEDLIVGGLDDGGIALWQFRSLKLSMRWTVFLEPLLTVISINDEQTEMLKDCVLCISGDGTVVAINLSNLELLFMIPGSATRLMEICLSESNILLMYADGRSRMWDLKTQEFWRSMATRTALELVSQGGWVRFDVSSKELGLSTTSLTTLPNSWISHDAGTTLLCDLHTLNDLIYPIAPSYQFKDPRTQEPGVAASENESRDTQPKKSPVRLKYIRSLIAALHTPGLDEEIDRVCREKLGIYESKTTIGVYWSNCISISNNAPSMELWQISPRMTASRLMALVALLRALSNFEEYEIYANQVIAFYVAALSDIVGQSWQSPSLEFLARYWFHHSQDIRIAARTLFGSTVIRQPDADIIIWTEFWQHELPCLQPDAEKQSNHSALALLITGNIAIERYSVLSTSTLTDIAKSITLYLHDEECPHRALVIDLCSRGFQIWQNHVDAVEVLRSLFALATSADRERNVAPQARSAVLQIASGNTPLFMTTLLLDIMHPKSLQQRKSILQLVAFLIRKKPLVLYPNLPRLVEAVVKSLDPSSSGERNAVFDAATEILAQVVKFFPSADFHMATQRLCVGTSEGAVIMYDLKTATRLYVLEGHKKQIDICSFSPDGRRLVTVSVEERVAKVWKVGSSFVSLFTPGAPPRQGHSGSDPYRSVPFNIGEVNLSSAAVFDHVRIEWPADRSARLKIKEIAFTFNT